MSTLSKPVCCLAVKGKECDISRAAPAKGRSSGAPPLRVLLSRGDLTSVWTTFTPIRSDVLQKVSCWSSRFPNVSVFLTLRVLGIESSKHPGQNH